MIISNLTYLDRILTSTIGLYGIKKDQPEDPESDIIFAFANFPNFVFHHMWVFHHMTKAPD